MMIRECVDEGGNAGRTGVWEVVGCKLKEKLNVW